MSGRAARDGRVVKGTVLFVILFTASQETLQSSSLRSADSSPSQGEPGGTCLPCFRGGGMSGRAASDGRVEWRKDGRVFCA